MAALSGGAGGLSASSSASQRTGDTSVGGTGITFGTFNGAQSNNTTLIVVAVAVLGVLWLLNR